MTWRHAPLFEPFETGEVRRLRGAFGSHLALIVARLKAVNPDRHVVLVSADGAQARQLAADLRFFVRSGTAVADGIDPDGIVYLPALETSPYAQMAPDRDATMRRLAVLWRLAQSDTGQVLVCSLAALRQRVLTRETFAAHCDTLVTGQDLPREPFVQRLVAGGYVHTPLVEDSGTFAVRGGILDLFVPLYKFPLRIEFWGDTIESMRLFDPGSQRTMRAIETLHVHPARETIAADPNALRKRVLSLADEVGCPSRKTRQVLDQLNAGLDFFGMEALTPAFQGRLVGVTEHLQRPPLFVVVDPPQVRQRASEEDARAVAGFESSREQGWLSFAPAAYYLDRAQIEDTFAGAAQLAVDVVGTGDAADAIEVASEDNAHVAAALQQARADRDVAVGDVLAQQLLALRQDGKSIVVAAGNQTQRDQLQALLTQRDIETAVSSGGADYLASEQPSDAHDGAGIQLFSRGIRRGFQLRDEQLVLLAEHEIFGPKVHRRLPKTARVGVSDLRQLKQGDFVVHALHGLGHYQGLVKLNTRGVPGDFLLLTYAGGDKLYLPVYRMNLVHKYVGAEGGKPRLDRLGGVTWQKKRKKVTDDVRRFGEELLQLYAQRAALPGFAFPEPDASYAEFVSTFPFDETPDQQRAIDDVLGDLTSERPMDRLVCGDVGFGKTEVALRAAFLVAMSGQQVGLLAPTTVLVEQHYRTFSDRLGSYPLRVEAVSRFRKPKQLRAALDDLSQGKVDIAIGTHRLLSSDVRFKQLGLMIVDEEQRFGVVHKERLKKMRTHLDVMTMTATPIPRTLQFAMIGLREISVIATPPADRLAVRTFICSFDDALVADAIRRELARGGQVFFVHPRVRDIEQWAERISRLVPEAKVVIGHGKMDARRLEQVMVDFVRGEFDILVCTTIIEAGLDIPRANTMFVNRAAQFGLSQLYQLRGRIGRGRQRAYCYLLTTPYLAGAEAEEPATPGKEQPKNADQADARRRLQLLQQFNQLGSGFSVASYDLELRGAGDLLGAKQSGHIAAVGFETYARLLEEAVAELKGEAIHRETDPEINARVAAFIPDDYVVDVGQRLELYKRLSDAALASEAEQEVSRVADDIRDRYGELPAEVVTLTDLMRIKTLATQLDAEVVDIGAERMTLTLGSKTPLAAESVAKLLAAEPKVYSLLPPGRLVCRLTEDKANPLAGGKNVLRRLLGHAKQMH